MDTDDDLPDLSDLTPEEREDFLRFRTELWRALTDPDFVDPDPEATEASWQAFRALMGWDEPEVH